MSRAGFSLFVLASSFDQDKPLTRLGWLDVRTDIVQIFLGEAQPAAEFQQYHSGRDDLLFVLIKQVIEDSSEVVTRVNGSEAKGFTAGSCASLVESRKVASTGLATKHIPFNTRNPKRGSNELVLRGVGKIAKRDSHGFDRTRVDSGVGSYPLACWLLLLRKGTT